MQEFFEDQKKHLEKVEVKIEHMKEQIIKNIEEEKTTVQDVTSVTAKYYDKLKKTFAVDDRSFSKEKHQI